MNLAKERKAIDAALDEYRSRLDAIPDELFTETPPGGGWSYAEVYSHIIKGTFSSSIVAERCAHGNTPATTKGPTLIGRYMLLTGSLPPLKLKVPTEIAAKMPAEKICKEDVKNFLVKCRKRVDTIMPFIKDAPPHSRSGNPRMGMLNAAQWLRFMRVHLYHHLKQLKRIENKFQSK